MFINVDVEVSSYEIADKLQDDNLADAMEIITEVLGNVAFDDMVESGKISENVSDLELLRFNTEMLLGFIIRKTESEKTDA